VRNNVSFNCYFRPVATLRQEEAVASLFFLASWKNCMLGWNIASLIQCSFLYQSIPPLLHHWLQSAENSTQNAPKRTIFHSEFKNHFLGGGTTLSPDPSPVGGENSEMKHRGKTPKWSTAISTITDYCSLQK